MKEVMLEVNQVLKEEGRKNKNVSGRERREMIKGKSIVFMLSLVVTLSGCATTPRVKREPKIKVASPPVQRDTVPSGIPVSVLVKVKAPNYRILNVFKKALSKIKRVRNIYQKKFSLSQDSELEVRYVGSTEKLADEIMSEIHIPEFVLEIIEFDQTSVTVNIAPVPAEQESY